MSCNLIACTKTASWTVDKNVTTSHKDIQLRMKLVAHS